VIYRKMKTMSPVILIFIGLSLVGIGIFQLLWKQNVKTMEPTQSPISELKPRPKSLANEPKVDFQETLDDAIEIAIADGTLSKKEEAILRERARIAGRNADELIRQLREELEGADNAETAEIDHSQKAGYDFEKYVVQKFSPKYFEITNWAGDKFVEGRFAKTTLQPDIQLVLRSAGKRYPLAVECKWRSNPKSEFVRFADDEQLVRYQKFAKTNNTPTFIVLGIGGKPSDPAEVFVIPIDRFNKPVQHLENLKDYKREDTNKGFYFDGEKGNLY
jgi:hypothetical protein